MAGETWKSHKNTVREADADRDHADQLAEWPTPAEDSTGWWVHDVATGAVRPVPRAELYDLSDLIQRT